MILIACEVAIKSGLGRVRRVLLDNGYNELSIASEHAVAIVNLSPIYKDPFDRILLAQAMVEGIILLTTDVVVAEYPSAVRKV